MDPDCTHRLASRGGSYEMRASLVMRLVLPSPSQGPTIMER